MHARCGRKRDFPLLLVYTENECSAGILTDAVHERFRILICFDRLRQTKTEAMIPMTGMRIILPRELLEGLPWLALFAEVVVLPCF